MRKYGNRSNKPYIHLIYGSDHNIPINFRAAEFAFEAITNFKKFNRTYGSVNSSSLINAEFIDEKLESIPLRLNDFVNFLDEEKVYCPSKFRDVINDIVILLFDIKMFYKLMVDAKEGIDLLDTAISLLIFVQNSVELF